MASSNSTDRDDIALSTSELDDVLSSADISNESGYADESGLEKYGIWIKVEPETLEPLEEAETSFEMADLEGEPEAGPDKLTAEEEQLLGELESEIETVETSAEPADFEGLEKDLQELGRASSDRLAEEDEDLTVADLDLDLDELALDQAEEPPGTGTAEVEVPLSDGVPELDSLEQAAESAGFSAAAAAGGRPSSDKILRKIEEDLKQIKKEIQNLKKELAGLGRTGAEVEVPYTPAAPGFFAEEEDDSIALTGDELDNILNTADITEEKAAGAGPVEELAEPAAEVLESLEPPAFDLMEPGSLTPAPEEIEIEFDEKPAGDLEILEGSADDLGPDLQLEPMLAEQPPAEAEELVLEDLSDGAAPELAPEEADELTLQDFSDEAGLETLAEAAPEAEELATLLEEDDLPSGEALPEVETEPVELELMEELGAPEPMGEELEAETPPAQPGRQPFPDELREDMKSVLSYLDQLLEALPKEKIEQFAQSEHFQVYTKLFKELGLEG